MIALTTPYIGSCIIELLYTSSTCLSTSSLEKIRNSFLSSVYTEKWPRICSFGRGIYNKGGGEVVSLTTTLLLAVARSCCTYITTSISFFYSWFLTWWRALKRVIPVQRASFEGKFHRRIGIFLRMRNKRIEETFRVRYLLLDLQ